MDMIINNTCFAPLLAERGQLDGAAQVRNLTDCGWDVGNQYRPLTSFCCGVIRGQGIAVRLFTRETEPRALCTGRDGPVWTDSCLEFFFQPKRGGAYLNLEMNANGAYLAVEVAPFRRADGWGVEAFIPFSLASVCFGEPFSLAAGDSFFANAYKCADDAPQPHYQALFPVGTPSPDFHRPEFFGTITVTEAEE